MTSYDTRLTVQGTGPPVVLVPGMDGTGLLFYRQTPLLARSYRVATYALRDDAEHMNRLVEDLASVVDAISSPAGRAIVVGESFGGALSLSFALAHPERVAALVILNSFPYFAPQLRLRLAIHGLGVLPWGAMPLVRRLTAFRLHSKHTHRDDVRRFLGLTRQSTKTGYIGRLRLLRESRRAPPAARDPESHVVSGVAGGPSGPLGGAGPADGRSRAGIDGSRPSRARPHLSHRPLD